MKLFDKKSSERLFQTSLDAVLSGSGAQDLANFCLDSGVSGEVEAAQWLVARQESLDPRPGFLSASRRRMIAAIQGEATRRPALRSVLSFLNTRPVHQFVLSMLLLVVLFTGHITVLAADTSIPGDTVYPIKLALEKVQLAASLNPNRDAQLLILFSQRRLSELQAIILEGRYENLSGVAGAFEDQISQTLSSLDRLDDADQQKVYHLIAGFNNSLHVQALTLAAFTSMVPVQDRGEVVAAIDASSDGTLKIENMMKQ